MTNRINDLELVKTAIKNGEVVGAAILTSCMNGSHLDTIKYLFEECKVDGSYAKYLEYGLLNACAGSHIDIVTYLLNKGAYMRYVFSYQIVKLLNKGLDVNLIKDKAEKFIKIRNDRNKAIGEILLQCTNVNNDVISVMCSYTEYFECEAYFKY